MLQPNAYFCSFLTTCSVWQYDFNRTFQNISLLFSLHYINYLVCRYSVQNVKICWFNQFSRGFWGYISGSHEHIAAFVVTGIQSTITKSAAVITGIQVRGHVAGSGRILVCCDDEFCNRNIPTSCYITQICSPFEKWGCIIKKLMLQLEKCNLQ